MISMANRTLPTMGVCKIHRSADTQLLSNIILAIGSHALAPIAVSEVVSVQNQSR